MAGVGVFLFFATPSALAIGLGPASLRSALGEPLRLSLPVTLQDGEDVGCVQVRPHGDDLPAVFNTRSSVVQSRGQTQIEISSPQPVNEPVIGVIVSVGCASPVARDYVLFLDPPVAPAIVAAESATRSTTATTAPTRSVTRSAPLRRAPARVRRVAPKSSAAPIPMDTRSTRRASPQTQTPASPIPTLPALPRASTPAVAATSVTPPPSEPDRLTVAPTERPKSPGAAGDPARAIASAAPGSAMPSATSGTPNAPAPVSAVSPPAALSSAVTPPSDAAALAAAREEQLRGEQADLQKQIKALTDQISAVRVQSSTLSARNQTLEAAAFSPTLTWLLIALSIIAIAIAGWMALRYVQLRRSLEGSAWWSGNTVLAPTVGEAVSKAAVATDAAAIDANTRVAGLQPDTRMPAAATVSTSNVQGRSRPTARKAHDPGAIDTDFTASDIEAAMATVRTVSPARSAPRPEPLEEADFAALGGPTITSPFTDPPIAASPASKAADARDDARHDARRDARDNAPDRRAQLDSAVGTADAPATFVDLNIPPIAPSRPDRKRAARVPQRIVEPEEEAMPLDFKLDIPQHYDDALATNSTKTTIVDRREPRASVDFELSSTPTLLDFELPSAGDVTPLSSSDRTHDARDAGDAPMRHAATALDDIFPPLGAPGVDTILDLDERDSAPLIPTEVDLLTSTETEGAQREAHQASTRFRMARFADLMHQVEGAARTDPLRAIAMLRQYVLRDEQIPTLLWLRLFELYKQVDKKPVYEALGEHFARRYRRPMIGWNESLADRAPQTPLTAMVEIDRDLEARWGTEEGLERLRSLLCDRNQPDAIAFNAVLQRDLLDAAKVFPLDNNSLTDFGGDDAAQATSSR